MAQHSPISGFPELYKIRDTAARHAISWLRRHLFQVSSDVSTSYLPKSGGTLTGDLNILEATPEYRITTSGDSEYSRWTRIADDPISAVSHYNQVRVPGGTVGNAFVTGDNNSEISAASHADFDLDGDFSLEIWYKAVGDEGTHTLLYFYAGASDQMGIIVTSTGFQFHVEKGGVHENATDGTGVPPTAGQWYCLTATYTSISGAMRLNVDGGFKGSATSVIDIGQVALNIGRVAGGLSQGGNGSYDEARVYKGRVLSVSDVAAHYNYGAGLYGGDLVSMVAGYHLDEAGGDITAVDYSSGGHDGTRSGGSWGAGIVQTTAGDATAEIEYIRVQDGAEANQEGIVTFGHEVGKTIIDGADIAFYIAGVEETMIDSSGNWDFLDSNLVTTGTLGAGNATLGTIGCGAITGSAGATFVSNVHINSAEVVSTTLLTLESDINNNNEYNEILFKIVGGANYGAIRSCVGAAAGNSYMSFFTTTDGGNLVRQMTIQHNGYVGIGTVNPGERLDVVGTAKVDSLTIDAQATDVSMNSHKITSVTDPTANQDAATKKYVDDEDANGETAFGWGDHAGGGYAAASHAMSTHSDEDTYNISTSGTAAIAGLNIGSGKVIYSIATDTAGINTDLAAVGEGGTVIIPKGSITIDDTIAFTDDSQTLMGLGWGSKLDGSGWSTGHSIDSNGKDYCIVRDLQIEGFPAGGQATALIRGDGSSYCSFINLWLHDGDSFGIDLRATSDYCRIESCLIETMPDYAVYADASEYMIFSNNHLVGNKYGVTTTGTSTFWQIFGNFFENQTNYAMYLIGNNTVVSSNLFRANAGHIQLNGSSNTTVTGNQFFTSTALGIYLLNSSRCSVTGNHFIGTANGQNDIHMAGSNDNTISGNSFSAAGGGAERAICLAGTSDRNEIIGNTSLDHDTAGIELEAGCDNNHVEGNNLEGETTARIIDNGANNTVLNSIANTITYNTTNLTGLGTIGCGVITQSGTTLALTYQPLDATLTQFASLLTAANKVPYATGADTGSELDLATTVGDPGSDTTLVSEQGIREALDAAGGGAWTQLAETTVGAGGAASIDWDSISGSYTHLAIMGNVRSEAVAAHDWLMIRFNNDGGGNYAYQYFYSQGDATAITCASSRGQVFGFMGFLDDNASEAGSFSSVVIHIPNYANANIDKMAMGRTHFIREKDSDADIHQVWGSTHWNNTVAITRVTILTDGGDDFAEHTKLTLWGII